MIGVPTSNCRLPPTISTGFHGFLSHFTSLRKGGLRDCRIAGTLGQVDLQIVQIRKTKLKILMWTMQILHCAL